MRFLSVKGVFLNQPQFTAAQLHIVKLEVAKNVVFELLYSRVIDV